MDLAKRAQPINREVRSYGVSDVELRDGGSKGLTFRGSASVVEHPYTVTDMFGDFSETVRAGAFDKTLSENPDVVFLVNHGGLPLARTTSGTLELSANPDLDVVANLEPSDPDVQRIEPKIRRGDLTEMSFAFRVTRQSWNEDYTIRDILEVSLHRGDVSTVTFGANPATAGALRFADIDVSEFVDAFAAAKRGDATDDQLQILARATTSLAELTTEPAPFDDTATRAALDDLGAKFEDVNRQLKEAAHILTAA